MKRTILLSVLMLGQSFIFGGVSVVAVENRPTFGGKNFYWGDMHAHSGYSSDGVGMPEEAYDSARNNKNDFFALSDHDEAFITNPYLCLEGVNMALAGTSQFECKPGSLVNVGVVEKWSHLKQVAGDKNEDGSFVAFYGYEWTHSGGHVNVFEAPTFVNLGYGFASLYGELLSHPDKANYFLQFNHPYEDFDFDGFDYDSRISPYFYIIETNQFWPQYAAALKKGWNVGAVGYGDGHVSVGSGSRRYGVLADSLTKGTIKEAMRRRATFGVMDGRAGSSAYPLAVALKINEVLMGGMASHSGSIDYEIYVKDALRDITGVKLWYGGEYASADRFLAAEFGNVGREKTIRRTFSDFVFEMPQRAKFAYVEVYQGGVPVAWTAPVRLGYEQTVLSPTPTNTPSPPSQFSCESKCYFGGHQCKKGSDGKTDGRCMKNVEGCGVGDYWNWSYCTGIVAPTARPTARPSSGPGPTNNPTPTNTPSPPSQFSCESKCYFGGHQCKKGSDGKTDGRCMKNVEGCGVGDYWNWSYCTGIVVPTARPSSGPQPTSIPVPTSQPKSCETLPRLCHFGVYQCGWENRDKTGGRCMKNVEGCGVGDYWNWSYCYN